jgi:hypothetical protein
MLNADSGSGQSTAEQSERMEDPFNNTLKSIVMNYYGTQPSGWANQGPKLERVYVNAYILTYNELDQSLPACLPACLRGRINQLLMYLITTAGQQCDEKGYLDRLFFSSKSLSISSTLAVGCWLPSRFSWAGFFVIRPIRSDLRVHSANSLLIREYCF